MALKIVLTVIITFALAGPTLVTFSETSQFVEIPMVQEKDVMGGIVLVIDASSSMSFRDVAPSRLEAAKSSFIELVENASENVRFGVIAFDYQIKNSLPITSNKSITVSTIEEIRASEAVPCLEEVTDIGYGLQTALDLLTPFTSSNRSYAIILISDGFANTGYPDPMTSVANAAERAANEKIPVHTVHVGRSGLDSNPDLLVQIARVTGATYTYSANINELQTVLDLLAKYHTPTNVRSATVELKVTIPHRTEFGQILMSGATIVILVLWIGNYKRYKTWF